MDDDYLTREFIMLLASLSYEDKLIVADVAKKAQTMSVEELNRYIQENVFTAKLEG